jgi:SAM-dependent methyltransferase
MDVKEEAILGPAISTHWYYVAKGRALRALLGNIRVPSVLDVGAGSGIFARQLLAAGICRHAICVDPAYDAASVEQVGDGEIRFVKAVDTPSPGLVLMMDVLEHVPNDVALLRQYTAALAGDAYVAITVPAFQWLWSGHDIFLEHYRRYTRANLEAAVSAAGLEVVKTRYFFASVLPVAAAMRLFGTGRHEARSALKQSHPMLNRGLIWLLNAERLLLFPFNGLAGLSVFCLARPRR